MPYNLLLLPLLGGYIYVRSCFRTRYNALRSEDYRLLFLAAQYGLYFLIAAALMRGAFNLLTQAIPSLSYIDRIWHAIFPFDYSGVAFLAFFLGSTLWKLVNRRYDNDAEVGKAIAEKGDPLEMLLQKAMDETKSVLITMKSGKVYVGNVAVTFNPAYDVKSVMIMPIHSGYRDNIDQTVTFNIDYTKVYDMIRNGDEEALRLAEDIGTVIPLEEIRSVSIFNLPLYQAHFAHTGHRLID
jgi:hypothetical protein